MTDRFLKSSALLALLCAGLAIPVSADDAQNAAKPNIVWIVLDACRAANLSCYGYERETSPNIDQLAREGVLFEQNYAQGFGTVVSVPSYLTGRYFPVSCLDTGNWRETFRQRPVDEMLFPAVCEENGYDTSLITSHHFFSPETPAWKAFDDAVFVEPRPGEPYAHFEMMLPAIEEALDGHTTRPFLLYIHAMDTHFPHDLPEPFSQWMDALPEAPHIKEGYVRKHPDEVFTEADQAMMRAMHDGSVLRSDVGIGQIVEMLKAEGLYANTIIIIGSDHGDLLGEDGRSSGHPGGAIGAADEVMRVPLVMAGPGLPENHRVTALTQNVDIVPTLVDLLGLKSVAAFDGASLAPLLRGETDTVHDHVLARGGGYEMGVSFVLRSNNMKLIHHAEEDEKDLLYTVPDRAGQRHRLEPGSAEATVLLNALESRYRPLWQAYKSLPYRLVDRPFVENLVRTRFARDGVAAGTVTPEDVARDNKWFYLTHQDRMWSNAFREDAPPLDITFDLPPGVFEVWIETYSRPEFYGHPASRLQVRLGSESDFVTVTDDQGRDGKAAWVYVRAGMVTVEDGTLTITIDDDDGGHWSHFRRFRFVPVQKKDEEISAEERRERDAALEALGYL